MLWNDADVEFVNCHFWKNESEHGGDNQGFNGGGAIAGYEIKRLVFKDCVFRNNTLINGTGNLIP